VLRVIYRASLGVTHRAASPLQPSTEVPAAWPDRRSAAGRPVPRPHTGAARSSRRAWIT